MNRVKALLGYDTAHVELAHKTASENREYCTKETSRKPGGLMEEWGEPCSQGCRTDLKSMYSDIVAGKRDRELLPLYVNIYAKYPRFATTVRNIVMEDAATDIMRTWKKDVYVLVGGSGTGKSRYVYYQHPEVYNIPIKRGQCWMAGYEGQPVVHMESYRGEIPYNLFLQLLDKYKLQVEVKGGHVYWCPRVIYITSTKFPTDWYPPNESDPTEIMRRITNVLYEDEYKLYFKTVVCAEIQSAALQLCSWLALRLRRALYLIYFVSRLHPWMHHDDLTSIGTMVD